MRISAMIIVLALALAGCGSSKSTPKTAPTAPSTSPTAAVTTPSSTPTEPDATAAVRAAVQEYSDAFLTGKGLAAYALLSKRCQGTMPAREFAGLVEQAGQLYGSALPFKSFHADVAGAKAKVTYTYAISAINQDREPWVLESGAWRNDQC